MNSVETQALCGSRSTPHHATPNGKYIADEIAVVNNIIGHLFWRLGNNLSTFA